MKRTSVGLTSEVHAFLRILILSSIGCQPTIAGDLAPVDFTLPNSTKVEVKESVFLAKNFRVDGCQKTPSCLINGYPVFGVPFDLPTTFVVRITTLYKRWSNSLDVRGMFNAWGTRRPQYARSVRYFGGSCFQELCHYRGLFSDGEGSFVAEWITIGNRSYRTIISDDPAVIKEFSANIDGRVDIP